MQATTTLPRQDRRAGYGFEALRSGVSWGAVCAGAIAAFALSLLLFILGSALGFAALSPWSDTSGKAVGIAAIAWVAFTQLAASAVGGYMAGRLRIRWSNVQGDEVFFRDTAHGLLTWALATLLMTALFAGSVRATLSGAIDAGAAAGTVAGPAVANLARDGGNPGMLDYYADMVLRAPDTPADANSAAARSEITRIFSTSMVAGSLSADDRAYLGRIVAKRTGMAPADAQARVDTVYSNASSAAAKAKADAKAAADQARRAAGWSSMWMVVALLLGAFVASLFATFGGRLRDDTPVNNP